MSDATIALATEYDPSEFVCGMFASQKLDGVPIKLPLHEDGTVEHCTRQNTQFKSIDHILEAAKDLLPFGYTFVGELWIPDQPFKVISGKARAHAPAPDLQLYIYDVIIQEPYSKRKQLWEQYTRLNHPLIKSVYDVPNGLNRHECYDLSDANRAVMWADSTWEGGKRGVEGIVFRHPDMLPAEAGDRCKGFRRYKPKPTIDLRIHSFEEAVSKDGTPLGMVGRINVEYKGKIIGVGAGKATHAERKAIFANQSEYIGKICEVQYMPDPTYDALRQPTFQRFRPDKTTPDA